MTKEFTKMTAPLNKEEPKKEEPKKEEAKKGKKKNPLDELMDQLEEYDEGCATQDLMSSGE